MFYRRSQRNHYCVAHVAVAAVLFQLLVTAWHVPLIAPAQTVPGLQSSIIVICTNAGVKRVVLDRNGDPVEVPDRLPHNVACPICLSLNMTDLPDAPASAAQLYAPKSTRVAFDCLSEIGRDRRPFVRCGLDPPLPV